MRFRDLPLRSKGLALLLVASVLPLVITALIEFRWSSARISASAIERLRDRGRQLAGDLDSFNSSLLNGADQLSVAPALRKLLEAPKDTALEMDVQRLFEALQRMDGRLRGVTLLNAQGVAVAASEPAMRGQAYAFRAYFQQAMKGTHLISDMYFAVPETRAIPSIAYAAPVHADDGRVLGVAVFYAYASAFWNVVQAADGGAGQGSFSVVYDNRGVRLAHSFDEKEVFHPGGLLSPGEVLAMEREQRFGSRTRDLLEHPFPMHDEFVRARGEGGDDLFRGVSPTNSLENVVATMRLKSAPWTLFSLMPVSSIDAPVRQLVQDTALGSIVVVVLALVAGTIMTSRMLAPVGAISGAAAAIRRGDLEARVPVESRDELGRLGEVFNDMAASLRTARSDLEHEVASRTAQLKQANEDLAHRNEAFEAGQSRDLAYSRALTALSADGPLAPAVTGALREVEATLGRLILACYRVDKQRLLPLANVGAGGMLSPVNIAGHVAEALEGKRMVVTELPSDSIYRFEVALASVPVRHVALIPLTVGDRTIGLLAAGAGGPMSPQTLSFLAELAVPLALTLGRYEMREKTERYAFDLAGRNEQLREQAAELNTRSQEVLAKQKELEAKNVEVERANRLKSEFLANMSHELRTPLNAVIGFSELMLEERAELKPSHRVYVDDILSSGRHLLTLINSVLDLAKIEAGKLTLDREPLLPEEQIRNASTLLFAVAQKKRIRVLGEGHGAARVSADRAKLQQVLLNLIGNAIKFSPDGSTVHITARNEGPYVRFSVHDEGPGISDAVARELFKPFVQGETALSKRHEGTGLGLAITQRLVEEHGGAVEVQTKEGRGSTFSFTMPLASSAPAVAPMPAAAQAPAAAREVHLKSVKDSPPLILVVEDDPSNARLLRAHLESDGYQVSLASTAQEAIDIADKQRPQLVLLDLILRNGEDGLTVLERLRRLPVMAKVPVVVVSVLPEKERSLEAGAVAFFLKPIDPPTILNALSQLLSRPRPGPVSGAFPNERPPKATILVVDDHEVNRELARSMLERRGYRVLLARNGKEGCEVARAERPALVLMDLAMPVMDGYEAAKELKADVGTMRIPLVALTAMAMLGDDEKASRAGFDGYLTKPLERAALEDALQRYVGEGRAKATND
jgi:signal transduction histidine kinase/DNA-binding response OmpR family regulator/HAMP domain-containing protein